MRSAVGPDSSIDATPGESGGFVVFILDAGLGGLSSLLAAWLCGWLLAELASLLALKFGHLSSLGLGAFGCLRRQGGYLYLMVH
jgi:hypothetical protein